jgi:3',5'-cyclic AMP phosphodiesterase CpdA
MILVSLVLFLSAADLRFAIVGDNTGRANPGVYERVWREVDQYKPDFAISTGDMIEGGSDLKVSGEWDAMRTIFAKLQKYPRVFAAGNHDIWSAKSRAEFAKFTGKQPAWFSVDFGKRIHITVVDNSQTESLSAEQLEFLEKDLSANQSQDVRFVCFHKPFWLIPLKLQSLKMPFHQMMKKYKVHTVFSGHVHQLHRLDREGIIYWSVPSAGGDLRGNAGAYERGWFYGYITGELKDQQQQPTFRIHELGPPTGQGRVIPAQAWGENGPSAK